MKQNCVVTALRLCGLLMAATAAAQETTRPPLEWGFEQRVRNENWNNIFDFGDGTDDQRVQVRYRTRAWLKASLTPNIDFFVGANQETNQIVTPATDNRFDEVVFDAAYLDVKKLFVKGLSLRAGRQNIMKGEGFLVFEGTTWDGSRSIYLNAAVLSYARRKSRLELMAISNPRMDAYLPKLHDRHKQLTEWDEQAVGAYFTSEDAPGATIEAYYFLKKETGDHRPATNFQHQPDRHVSTLGGRAVRKLGRGWSLHGEGAAQWGAQHPATPVHGWAGYAYARKAFAAGGRPVVSGGYWGFSGDDPRTSGRVEGWDPLFARWPKWSEMYIYSQFREAGPGYWTNLGMWQGEFTFTPRKPVDLRFTYYKMSAFHPFPGDPRMFADGTSRGHHYQVRADFALHRTLKGHVLWEHLLPGAYYRAKSPASFLRFELIFAVRGEARL